MKRRSFFKKLAAASLAFSVGPTAFKCLPAARNVRAVVVTPKMVPFWLQTIRGSVRISKEYAAFFSEQVAKEPSFRIASPWQETSAVESYADFKARLDAARKADA